MENIFENIPDKLHQELFQNILENKNLKIERILSKGHSSPPGFWYDQSTNEFVLLLKGSAELSFENDRSVKLKPGDYLIIPAHKKHRVDCTDPDTETIWLAIHY